MSVPHWVTLFDYSDWANHRIADAAGRLTEEQRHARPFAIDSIHTTLAHLVATDWLWRQRRQGQSPATVPQATDFPTFDALRARWDEEQAAMRAYLATLTDADLDRSVTYRTMSGQTWTQPVWQILAQMLNHATQHRSEVAAMLTEMGASPGNLDFFVYLRETASAS